MRSVLSTKVRLPIVNLLIRLLGRRDRAPADLDLYHLLVRQARHPAFYAALGVPDTLDGRFDMIVVHAFIVMRRLKGNGTAADGLSRRVYERMVDDFDQSLREMGVGDVGVGKHIKAMVRGVQGRLMAYDRALASGDAAQLEAALDNNLYGTVPDVPRDRLAAMAAYIRQEAERLAGEPVADLLEGRVSFGAPVVTPTTGGTILTERAMT